MSTLFKQSTLPVFAPNWRGAEPVLESADPRIAAFEEKIVALEARTEAHQSELEEAVAAAVERGRKQAEAEFVRNQDAALKALEQTLAGAAAEASRRLNDLDALALSLAQTALANVFERAGDFDDLLKRAIAHELRDLKAESVLSVVVSGADFDSDEKLLALAGRIGAATRIERDLKLDAGACRIALRLGEIELSLPEYWSALRAKLASLATPEDEA